MPHHTFLVCHNMPTPVGRHSFVWPAVLWLRWQRQHATCPCALQEWMTPQPSRRPDPMPEFEKLETPLPRKLPGDPEVH